MCVVTGQELNVRGAIDSQETRSRTLADKCNTFRPQRSSSVTQLKRKVRDWPLYSRVPVINWQECLDDVTGHE